MPKRIHNRPQPRQNAAISAASRTLVLDGKGVVVAGPVDVLTDEQGDILTDDIGQPLLAA